MNHTTQNHPIQYTPHSTQLNFTKKQTNNPRFTSFSQIIPFASRSFQREHGKSDCRCGTRCGAPPTARRTDWTRRRTTCIGSSATPSILWLQKTLNAKPTRRCSQNNAGRSDTVLADDKRARNNHERNAGCDRKKRGYSQRSAMQKSSIAKNGEDMLRINREKTGCTR